MKVLAINGSPRPSGNTSRAVRLFLEEIEKQGIETEVINLGTDIIRGCTACGHCIKTKDNRCVFGEDGVNEGIQKMMEADGILLASPVHYSNISGTMKSFLDRAFFAISRAENPLRHKVGAALVCVRRAGGVPAWQALNNYLGYSEMILATGSYWPMVYGAAPGEAEQDTEGTAVIKETARNMAWLLKMKADSDVPAPEWQSKKPMNFIR